MKLTKLTKLTKLQTVFFAGGGSLGHVAPGIAVAQALKTIRPEMRPLFICAPRTEETALLSESGMEFRTLNAGKFPRGLSAGWITFPILFIAAWIRAFRLIMREKPAAVFSKGGFISAPVSLAAWIKKIPIILHESDAVTGLSNRLISKVAQRICLGFPVTRVEDPLQDRSLFQSGQSPAGAEKSFSKTVFTGNPVRASLLPGSRDAGKRITGFSGNRPIVMVTGGSQGSVALNGAVEAQLEKIVAVADIIHLTGRGKSGSSKSHARYWRRESVTGDIGHLYALADIIVSRAGAGTLSEIARFSKPVIAVPLRGVAGDHQWINAQRLVKADAIRLLEQTNLDALADEIKALLADPKSREKLGRNLAGFFPADADTRIAKEISKAINGDQSGIDK